MKLGYKPRVVLSGRKINDKMSKLDQEVTIRSDTVKTMNREVKIEELSRLIEERRMMVDSMNSLI